MTPRGAALLLVPVGLIAAGARLGVLLWVGLAGLVLAAAAIVLDARAAPGGDRLDASREHAAILSVGRPNRIRLRIDADGPPARATIRDEHPPGMAASRELIDTVLPAEVEYTLTPPARGRWDFGRTVVRARGPLRLGERITAAGAPSPARVDPDLSAVSAYDALARRGQLAELGVRAIRNPGEGTEFERIRDAVPDDPLRSINWKATARAGRLMASELVPERAQPVIVCLDHGRLMGVGAGALTKLDHAVNAALLLAHVALRTGDRVGLLAFSDHVTAALTPRAGRAQLRAILDALEPIRGGDTEADYDEALGYVSRWQQRRSLLCIFTDVIDPDQGQALLRQCVRLRRRHLPLVITVRDPALDDVARRRPVDALSTYERSVASTIIADRADTLLAIRRSGVDTLDADARTLSPRLVNRYLELKRHARL